MIKRLNSVYTKSISNKRVVNSIEEYTSRYDRSIEDANPSKLKQFLAFLKKIIKIILNAIGNFINKFTSIFTGKVKYYTAKGKYVWSKKFNSVNIEQLLKDKLIFDIINSKICMAKPNLPNLEKKYEKYKYYSIEFVGTQHRIEGMGESVANDSERQRYIKYIHDVIEFYKELEDVFQNPELNKNEHISNQQSIVKSFFNYEFLPYKTGKDGHIVVGNREIKKIIDVYFNDNVDKWCNFSTNIVKHIRTDVKVLESIIDDVDDLIIDLKDKELIDVHQQLLNSLGTLLKIIYSFSSSLMHASIAVAGVVSIMGAMFVK